MTNNNTLTEGELNSNTKKNIQEKANKAEIDTSKSNERISFYRSLEAFSDCI
tara:strand:- start:166 stop:321 length:156 start_codon:yes stop_codon:yes gene_type:complete